MRNIQLYIGGINGITYRYDIKNVDDVFNVIVFSVAKCKQTKESEKLFRNVTIQDAIDECLSHYRRKSSGLSKVVKYLIKYVFFCN